MQTTALWLLLLVAGPTQAYEPIWIVDYEIGRTGGKNRGDDALVAGVTLMNVSGRTLWTWEGELGWVRGLGEVLCTTEVAFQGPVRRGERIGVELVLRGSDECSRGTLIDSVGARLPLSEVDPEFVAVTFHQTRVELEEVEPPPRSGLLSPVIVEAIVGQDPDVELCLLDSPDMRALTCGRVWVSFAVQEDGSVTDVQLSPSCFTDLSVTEPCVRDALQDLRFPPMAAGPKKVRYPYSNPWMYRTPRPLPPRTHPARLDTR
jgi:hypothetical protein